MAYSKKTKRIGERLQRELDRRNLSARQAAEKAQVSKNTMASWLEGNSPSMDKLFMACERLNIPMEDLLCEDDEYLELEKDADTLSNQYQKLPRDAKRVIQAIFRIFGC